MLRVLPIRYASRRIADSLTRPHQRATFCSSISTGPAFSPSDRLYYESLATNFPVEVKLTHQRGRALFAKRHIAEGEVLFSDSPIVAAPASVDQGNASCEMCFRPLVPTQLMLVDPATREATKRDPARFREFKENLLRRLRVTKLELSSDNDDRHFCSPACRDKFHATFSAAPRSVKQISSDASITGITSVKDRSVLDLIVRLLVMTNGYTIPLPGHSSRMCADGTLKTATAAEKAQFDLIIQTVPIAQTHFKLEDFLRLKSLIRLNGFSIATFPITIMIKSLKQSPPEWDVQILRDKQKSVTISALYTFGSLCNHSCSPSVGLQAGLSSTTVDWIALRDIPAGEELKCSYVSLDEGSDILGDAEQLSDPLQRKAALLSEYGFQCDCPICSKLPEIRLS